MSEQPICCIALFWAQGCLFSVKTAKEGLGVNGVCCVCCSSCPRERPCAGFQLPADGSSGSAQRQLCLLTCLCPHCSAHITLNSAILGYSPLPCCKPAIASESSKSYTGEWRGNNSAALKGKKCQKLSLSAHPPADVSPHTQNWWIISKKKCQALSCSFSEDRLIFPGKLGDNGKIPPPLEGLWGLPHCYPAFPWDLPVHGITLKGKDSLLAFLNTNNDFRGRKGTIRYCCIVPYLSLTLKYLRSPMNNAASAPSLFCTSH